MMSCSLIAMADDSKTCPVKGTTGQVAATVSWLDEEKCIAVVNLSNDSKEDVSVIFTVQGDSNISNVRKGNTLVKASQTASVTLQFPSTTNTKIGPVLKELSGIKCDN